MWWPQVYDLPGLTGWRAVAQWFDGVNHMCGCSVEASKCREFRQAVRWFPRQGVGCCFLLVFAEMDSVETFDKMLSDLSVVEGVRAKLKERGYTTAAGLYWALEAGAETTFQHVLEAASVEVGQAASIMQTLEAGKLRRLLCDCKRLCTVAVPAAPEPTSTAMVPISSGSHLLGIELGPKLGSEVLQQLWLDFDKKYPAEVLTAELKPCRQLVQAIYTQKMQGELRFIPWRNILSQAEADKVKQFSQKKEKAFMDILAEAAGQSDVPEVDPSASPFAVQKLLHVRAICWALLGWCHLGAARSLTYKFIDLYAVTGLGALGLRGPSLAEAEAADAECCRQLSALMARGHTLDQALHEVVEVRNSLHMWLQPRPRFAPLKPSNHGKGAASAPYGQGLSKQSKKGGGKGKGKREGKRAGTCHGFQAGKCNYGKACRFLHECEMCGDSNHGSAACPQKAVTC